VYAIFWHSARELPDGRRLIIRAAETGNPAASQGDLYEESPKACAG
jgi:hypothetical protein